MMPGENNDTEGMTTLPSSTHLSTTESGTLGPETQSAPTEWGNDTDLSDADHSPMTILLQAQGGIENQKPIQKDSSFDNAPDGEPLDQPHARQTSYDNDFASLTVQGVRNVDENEADFEKLGYLQDAFGAITESIYTDVPEDQDADKLFLLLNEMKTELDKLEDSHEKQEGSQLHATLSEACQTFRDSHKDQEALVALQSTVNTSISSAKANAPRLFKNYSFTNILKHFLGFVMSLGVGYLVYLAVDRVQHGKCTFFSTETSRTIDKIEKTVNKLKPTTSRS